MSEIFVAAYNFPKSPRFLWIKQSLQKTVILQPFVMGCGAGSVARTEEFSLLRNRMHVWTKINCKEQECRHPELNKTEKPTTNWTETQGLNANRTKWGNLEQVCKEVRRERWLEGSTGNKRSRAGLMRETQGRFVGEVRRGTTGETENKKPKTSTNTKLKHWDHDIINATACVFSFFL